MPRRTALVLPPALLALALSVAAAEPAPPGLSPSHPLIGTWRIELPALQCHELYVLRADGTSTVTSAQEQAESEFTLSPEPDEQGFYKLTDRVVADNGKPDCAGDITPVGDVSVTWIRLHPQGKSFLMCFEANLRRCLGPFVRQEPI